MMANSGNVEVKFQVSRGTAHGREKVTVHNFVFGEFKSNTNETTETRDMWVLKTVACTYRLERFEISQERMSLLTICSAPE